VDEGHPGLKPHSSIRRCADETALEQPRMSSLNHAEMELQHAVRNLHPATFAMTAGKCSAYLLVRQASFRLLGPAKVGKPTRLIKLLRRSRRTWTLRLSTSTDGSVKAEAISTWYPARMRDRSFQRLWESSRGAAASKLTADQQPSTKVELPASIRANPAI
jgi:hypothetical protein